MHLSTQATWLKEYLVHPMEAQPTGTVPVLGNIAGLRAVVFDIYGTLFLSGSGDIGVTVVQNRDEAMLGALEKAGIHPVALQQQGLASLFVQYIQREQEHFRMHGVQFPEVEIRRVWKTFLEAVLGAGLGTGNMPDAAGIEALAVDYECRVNPVWPMPGLKECLARLHDSHLLMGIVSNAQFFTPPLFEAFLGRTVEGLDFEPSCTGAPYKMHEAKPSQRLFELLEAGLREHGFSPEQALYVGNDMRNDIAPAAALGFKTCLFAGDSRSLRLRPGDPLVAGVVPDRVITHLDQLAGLFETV